MNCPKCDYFISSLDTECRRCHGKGMSAPTGPGLQQHAPAQPSARPAPARPPSPAVPWEEGPPLEVPLVGASPTATPPSPAKPISAQRMGYAPLPKSCAKCGHWKMYKLERFTEDDVNESPTIDGYGSRMTRLYLMVWFANLIGDKVKTERRRKRVRQLRAEVLLRAPGTLICPSCLEFLERD